VANRTDPTDRYLGEYIQHKRQTGQVDTNATPTEAFLHVLGQSAHLNNDPDDRSFHLITGNVFTLRCVLWQSAHLNNDADDRSFHLITGNVFTLRCVLWESAHLNNDADDRSIISPYDR